MSKSARRYGLSPRPLTVHMANAANIHTMRRSTPRASLLRRVAGDVFRLVAAIICAAAVIVIGEALLSMLAS